MTKSNFISQSDYVGLHLFNESGTDIPVDASTLSSIAKLIQDEENCTFHLVEVVFIDADEIVSINKEHLERDYVTDIITFRYDEGADNQAIEGTLYCCAPRIAEQARELNQPDETEFKRIIIHGLLHLVGYDDQSPDTKKRMSAREDFFLTKV